VRRIGIALVLLGIGAATWFTWLARPDTESRCDREPNLVMATAGPDNVLDLPTERECRRLATVELAKGMGLGGSLVIGGLVLIAVGSSRHRVKTDRAETAAAAAASRGRRSEDGSQWWDGYRWLPIHRDE